MAFEVQPTPVRPGHWRLSIVFAVAVAASVVGVAFATRVEPPPAVRVSSLTVPLRTTAALPSNVDCHDVARDDCLRAASAAIKTLARDVTAPQGSAPRIQTAAVWRSLLCSSTFDCPPSALASGSVALGSVTLGLSTGMEAWFNVVDRSAPGSAVAVADAWMVRWR